MCRDRGNNADLQNLDIAIISCFTCLLAPCRILDFYDICICEKGHFVVIIISSSTYFSFPFCPLFLYCL